MIARPFSLITLPTMLRRVFGNVQMVGAALSLAVGLGVGAMVVAFREGISFFHNLFFGAPGETLFLYVAELPWWHVIGIPTLGGLVVGLLVHFTLRQKRTEGLVDVIEANALNQGNMRFFCGIRAAFINAFSIGVGASVGREGPAVHLGAAMASGFAQALHLPKGLTRTLLGCGVAAAVAASFNAPIAGALFAGEVVIGHYALTTFAPVVIAAVAGTVVSREFYGDFPAFSLPEHAISSYLEYPAFVVLGVLAGLTATALLKGIFKTQDLAERLPGPVWLRPAFAGFCVGVIAIFLPQVMGVGYGPTNLALSGDMAVGLLVLVFVAKMVATVLSLGMGFGGGIFSPSLMIGAMLGGAYGGIIISVFPALDTGLGDYTLIGMGAVAAATLGAPISTTLIIFELTGDYELTLGVMLAVVVSTGITREILGKNFFSLQLQRRGLDLQDGFETQTLRGLSVIDVLKKTAITVTPDLPLSSLRVALQKCPAGELFMVDGDGKLKGTITLADMSECAFDESLNFLINAADVARRSPPFVELGNDLESALKLISETGESTLAVIDNASDMTFLGTIEEAHVMSAYNRALLKTRSEEHDQ